MTWPADGGIAQITVSAPGNCDWSVDWNAPWITPLQTSGSGNTVLSYAVDRNDSGVTRSGTLTVGGATFSIEQTNVFTGNPPQGSGGGSSPSVSPSVCEFAVSPFVVVMGSGGGAYQVTVKAPAGCPSSILSAPSWTTFAESSGTGTWTTLVTVAANSTADRRYGTVTLSGVAFAIDQSVGGMDAATIQSFGGDIGGSDPRYLSIQWELAAGTNLVTNRLCDGPCHDLPPVLPPDIPDAGPREGKLDSSEIEWRQGTSTYDPRVPMADYARQLLAASRARTKTDCESLALLAYKAGQLAPFSSAMVKVQLLLSTLTQFEWFYLPLPTRFQPHSDPQFQVGVNLPSIDGFGDRGFKAEFQDDSNQVRHFVASFAAGFIFGKPAADVVTWIRELTFSSENKDVALGELAATLGHYFGSNDNIGDHAQLAQDIWSSVCGQTTPLQLPQQ